MELDMNMVMLWTFLGTVLYILPTSIAMSRDCKAVYNIGILNMFFGWTIIGWVVLLYWSLYGKRIGDNGLLVHGRHSFWS